MRVLLIACCLLLCNAAWAEEPQVLWLQGAYYDNLNKLNLKEGIAFLGPYTPVRFDPEKPWQEDDIPIKYADIELGGKGVKGTLGMGHYFASEWPVIMRAGLSYAHFRTQDLAGVEAVVSGGFPVPGSDLPIPVGVSFKLGLYAGLNHTPNRFMIGLGLGL